MNVIFPELHIQSNLMQAIWVKMNKFIVLLAGHSIIICFKFSFVMMPAENTGDHLKKTINLHFI